MKVKNYRFKSTTMSLLTNEGGSINCFLALSRDPVDPLEVATKSYVDSLATNIDSAQITSGTFSDTLFPTFSGDIVKPNASNVITLSNSPVTPSTYTKVAVDDRGIVLSGSSLDPLDIPDLDWSKVSQNAPTSLAGYGIIDGVSVNGDVLQGNLLLHGDPINPNELVTRQYIDNIVSSAIEIKTGDIIRSGSSVLPTDYLRCNGAMVDKTLYNALYLVIGDTYTLLNNGIYIGAGKPWNQQTQINSTNTTIDITGWSTSVNTLPVGLSDTHVVVTNAIVYLIGGFDDTSPVNTVYSALINTNGTLGSWVTETPLPGLFSKGQVLVIKNKLYLIGGHDGTNALSTVYSTTINTDGTLNTWIQEPSIPVPLYDFQAIALNGHLYLIGGHDGTSYVQTVYKAVINTDASLGTWSSDNPLPVELGKSQVAVTDSHVYMLGGITNTSWTAGIYTALINPDGTLGTWYTSSTLPGILSESQVVITDNRLYLLGGYNGVSYTTTVYNAAINPDGTIGSWSSGTLLPTPLSRSSVIVTSTMIYLLGGMTVTGALNSIIEAPFTGGLNDYSSVHVITPDPTLFKLPDFSTKDLLTGINHYIKF